MSTNAYIGMELPDHTIKCIYLHWDGYVEKPGAGFKLKSFYMSPEKVKELIDLGDLSALESEIGEKHDFDNFDVARENNWTTAYGRDREEEGVEAKITTEGIEKLSREMGYAYVYRLNEKWYYSKNGGKEKKL